MSTRTSQKTVTFNRPFYMDGIERLLPAGDYVVETEEERLDGLSFLAYRRVGTRLFISPDARSMSSEMWFILPKHLDEALERDAAAA